MKHILVFGSLRKFSKRGYNFDRFGKGSQTYVQDVTLKGFEMVSLGAYPAIYPSDKGQIKTELHAVTDAAFNSIQRMEAGAGYDELELDVDGIKATIFTMSKNNLTMYRGNRPLEIVESGDWE